MRSDNKTFLKSLSVLTAGSAISIIFLAIQHVALPLIFSPEELGIKSVILALPTACIAILCGRYDLTLVYEKDEKSIFPLLKLNFFVNVLLSSLLTLINCFYFAFFKRSYLSYWYVIPAIWLYLVSYGLTLILNSYNNRYKEYKLISKMYVIRSAAQSLGPVLLGLIFVYYYKMKEFSVAILVIPYCVGMSFGLYSQGKKIIQERHSIFSCSNDEVKSVAKRHIKQPLLSAPAMLANGFSYSLITMMTDSIYDVTTTGLYSLSITLLGLPITMISGNMSKVYTRDAATEYEKTGGFRATFKKNFMVLFALAIPMFFCMFFIAPQLIVLLYGQKWEMAGKYIQALSIMFSFRFISTALSPGLYICKKQVAELVIQVVFVIVTALAGFLAYAFGWDSIVFMWVLGGFRSIVMLIHILLVFLFSGVSKERSNNE